MIILLSPAKSLDYESPLPTKKNTLPRLLDDSESLIKKLRTLNSAQLGTLMSISEKLSDLNAERYTTWEKDFTPENSRPALYAFKGDVYQGFDFEQWKAADITLAQKQIRILSGLYGVLRPLDLMQPYRLEMGTKLAIEDHKNLYQFWGNKITDIVNADLIKSGNDFIINLASMEYFKSINKKELKGKLITPVFKDEKNGKYKIIAFFAKKARGMMADHLIRNQVTDLAGLKKFKTAGYKYSAKESSDSEIVFLRKEQ